MNWFTNDIVVMSSNEHKQNLIDKDSACKHAEKDASIAYANMKEMDSFGPVSTYVCCKACYDEAKQLEGEIDEHCKDCGLVKKRKDGFFWRWYDFYAPQGDEPLFVCNECQNKPTHLKRVADDNADREAEFGPEDHYDPNDNVDVREDDDNELLDWVPDQGEGQS